MLDYGEVSNKRLCTRAKNAALEQKKTEEIDITKFKVHEACDNFYSQKLTERELIENQDQRTKTKSKSKHCHNKNCSYDCICNCKRCRCDQNQSCICDRKSMIKDWDKGYVSLWIDRCKQKDAMFESDCAHGRDCQRINNCRCTLRKSCVPQGERESAKDSKKNKKGKESETFGEELRLQGKYQRQRLQSEDWNPLEDLEE